ncbi:hypothetical protein [Microbacterium sp. Root180]|uniref:hypothetical protein n=1 Tax=Microbacterium sp. Root180 TaxID=1736483 RepID=UPI0006FF38FF|nr:hypothetical protein [Microbacterium sp. Root180]KRB36782.1 hypothetical protein ASD93_12165 [Microbacterium sp. Root180]
MTLIVGAIDARAGTVHLAGDSKITWAADETRSRKIYSDPVLKVIRLSEGLAVGYAGAGPSTLAERVGNLRGLERNAVLDGLAQVGGATFIVAGNGAQLWRVEDGEWAEVTSEGLVIAGDDEDLNGTTVFELVRARYGDFPDDSARSRLMSTMQHLIQFRRPSTIGGMLVMLSSVGPRGFRYDATPSVNFNAIYSGEPVERPVFLHTLPGDEPTPGAVGFWVENAGSGHLFKDGEPHIREEIRSATLGAFVTEAEETFGQVLVVPREDPITGLFRQL